MLPSWILFGHGWLHWEIVVTTNSLLFSEWDTFKGLFTNKIEFFDIEAYIPINPT